MNEFDQDIEHCLTVLKEGGIVLYPTDTVWGIGCDATNAAAVDKIFELKGRPKNKSMIVLLAEEKDLLQYVAAPDPAVFGLLEKTERPTTVVYDHPLGLAANVLHEDGSVGIRVVQDTFCRHLIKRFRKPIVSTSANLSGDPTPASFKNILSHIVQGVDYVVKYRQDDETPAQASSVVKLNRDGTLLTIRP